MSKYAVVKKYIEQVTQFSGFNHLHPTLEEAKTEAERLCRKEKATFYVVELLEKCFTNETPVTWEKV